MRQETQSDERGESPARSILGLGRVEPAPFRIARPPGGANGGPPPTSSLLGLQDIEYAGKPLPASADGADGAPPTASLLGLQQLRRSPLILPAVPPNPDEEPPNRSLLGLATYRPPPGSRPARPRVAASAGSVSFFGLPARAPETRRPAEPVSRSFFGLQAPPARMRSIAPAEMAEMVPEFERDVEHRAEPAFPVERAVLASLLAHALLLLLLFRAPSVSHDPRKGLLAGLVPKENPAEDKVPIIFREAPGPTRENPKKSADLSDADRRAGGGDPSKKRAESPYVPERPGIAGLRPGAPIVRAPFQPPAPARPGPESPSKMAQAPEAKEETAPDGFRVPRNGPSREGTSEPRALSDIASVAKDAARQVVSEGGGEAGAGFPNPDGGLVDTGPVSFETKWYDWGEYMAAMLRRIKLHHAILRDPFKGWVTYRWAILPEGQVAELQMLDSSGNPAYDAMARRAIETSNPFRALPKDLLESLGAQHREHVTVTFIYNYSVSEFENLVRARR